MAEYIDMGAWALETLRANAAVLALVVGGAARIVDAGQVTGVLLDAAEKERRDAGQNDRVLALCVVDTGETGPVGSKVATLDVYIYDRQRGYANTRNTREAVIAALVNKSMALVRGAAVVQVVYSGRTGFVQFEDFDLDYERVSFSGPVAYAASGDVYS